MRITLKEQYAQNWKNWKAFPRPIKETHSKTKLQARIKIAKSLIENGHVEVKFKTLTNPGLKVHPKVWTRRANIHMTYEYSNLNAYLFHFPTWRRPLNFVKPTKKGQIPKVYPKGTDEWLFKYIKYMPARRTKHYKHKRFIKATYNDDMQSLDYIIFKAGWANSIKHARHLIRKAQITVDGVKVYNFKFIPNKGSLITNLSPDSLFNYYRQKYHANFRKGSLTKIFIKRGKKFRILPSITSAMDRAPDPAYFRRFKVLRKLSHYECISYPFAIQPQYITKTNFNQILYL